MRKEVLAMKLKDHATEYQVFKFIEGYINKHGYSPSQKEIRESLCCSSYVVRSSLNMLQENGYIKRVRMRPRSLSLAGYKYVRTDEALL